MSWRDHTFDASFRGVGFFWSEAPLKTGRRAIKREYPERERGAVEDNGKLLREFPVTGYVLGDDYLAQRDALIDALETPGAGLLVHPRFGQVTVQIGSVEVTESDSEGGVARFTFEATEAGDLVFPTILPTLETHPDDVESQTSALFQDAWSIDGAGFLSDDAIAAIGDFFGSVTDAVAVVGAGAAFAFAIADIIDSAATLVADPEALALALADAFGLLDVVETAVAIADLFASTPSVTSSTEPRAQAQKNRRALTRTIRRTSLVSASRSVSTTTLGSYDEAISLRDRIAARLDTERSEDDVDATTWDAMSDLRAEVVEVINGRAADLARLVTSTPVATTSTLELAALHYDDAERADDIAARNAIVHPGFVPSAPLRLEAV